MSTIAKKGALPLIMEFAREIQVPPNCPATYNPITQVCDEFETLVAMGGRNRSTCTRSSSTREGLGDMFKSSDSDRKVDD